MYFGTRAGLCGSPTASKVKSKKEKAKEEDTRFPSFAFCLFTFDFSAAARPHPLQRPPLVLKWAG
jgi:hypothetical protein